MKIQTVPMIPRRLYCIIPPQGKQHEDIKVYTKRYSTIVNDEQTRNQYYAITGSSLNDCNARERVIDEVIEKLHNNEENIPVYEVNKNIKSGEKIDINNDLTEITKTKLINKIKKNWRNVKRSAKYQHGVNIETDNNMKRLSDKNYIWNEYYKDQQVRDNSNWTAGSILHSTTDEGFSFVVYSCSHLLSGTDQIIHRGTRLKLVFPSMRPYIILFHGRLVHSGAASSGNSLQKRFFAFVSDRNKEKNANKDGAVTDYSVHRENITLCGPDCTLCSNVTNDDNDMNILDFTILDSGNSDENESLFGDYDDLGWVVYNGYDMGYSTSYNHNVVDSIPYNIQGFVYKDKKKWKKIDRTERRHYIFQESDYRSCVDIANIRDMLELTLKQRTKNEYWELITFSLLANFGIFDEQIPHRDYGTKDERV